jgi:hypothetical protein
MVKTRVQQAFSRGVPSASIRYTLNKENKEEQSISSDGGAFARVGA